MKPHSYKYLKERAIERGIIVEDFTGRGNEMKKCLPGFSEKIIGCISYVNGVDPVILINPKSEEWKRKLALLYLLAHDLLNNCKDLYFVKGNEEDGEAPLIASGETDFELLKLEAANLEFTKSLKGKMGVTGHAKISSSYS